METKDITKKLCDLIQLDIDAVEAYEQALKNIDDKTIHGEISAFMKDHEGHIHNLGKLVREIGGTPPERGKDFKGFLIKGFTAVRSMTGVKGALKAMETNEQLTNRYYHDAMKENLPENIKNQISKNYEDEKRHLEYIRTTLEKL